MGGEHQGAVCMLGSCRPRQIGLGSGLGRNRSAGRTTARLLAVRIRWTGVVCLFEVKLGWMDPVHSCPPVWVGGFWSTPLRGHTPPFSATWCSSRGAIDLAVGDLAPIGAAPQCSKWAILSPRTARTSHTSHTSRLTQHDLTLRHLFRNNNNKRDQRTMQVNAKAYLVLDANT